MARPGVSSPDDPLLRQAWLKQPLTVSAKAGGAEHLVAPKRRAEAEGLSGDKLIAWLAQEKLQRLLK